MQLLKDWRAFNTPHGGAGALDESYVSGASYGPAGLTMAGSGFEKRDVKALEHSFRVLTVALRRLRAEHFQEWAALIEPYLSDTADPSVVDDWRRKVAELDAENAKRRKRGQPERVAYLFARTQLERHDRAIARLSRWLEGVELHVVNPRLMSASEEAAGEKANAQMMAYYHQVRTAGRTHTGAISALAWKFGISEDRAETLVEFRSENKLASCAEEGCGRAVYSQNLCSKHYQRQLKKRRRAS